MNTQLYFHSNKIATTHVVKSVLYSFYYFYIDLNIRKRNAFQIKEIPCRKPNNSKTYWGLTSAHMFIFLRMHLKEVTPNPPGGVICWLFWLRLTERPIMGSFPDVNQKTLEPKQTKKHDLFTFISCDPKQS